MYYATLYDPRLEPSVLRGVMFPSEEKDLVGGMRTDYFNLLMSQVRDRRDRVYLWDADLRGYTVLEVLRGDIPRDFRPVMLGIDGVQHDHQDVFQYMWGWSPAKWAKGPGQLWDELKFPTFLAGDILGPRGMVPLERGLYYTPVEGALAHHTVEQAFHILQDRMLGLVPPEEAEEWIYTRSKELSEKWERLERDGVEWGRRDMLVTYTLEDGPPEEAIYTAPDTGNQYINKWLPIEDFVGPGLYTHMR